MARGSAGHGQPKEPESHGTSVDAAAELELLRKVLRLTQARILYYERDHGIRYATSGASRALGMSPEKLDNATLDELGLAPERRRPFDAIWARIMATGQPVHEVVTFDIDGELRDTELHVEPSRDPRGEIEGIVVTAWDVTELREALRRIRLLDRVRAILSQTNQAIVRAHDAHALLAETCRIAVELGGFPLAWVGLVEPDGGVRVAARAGSDSSVLDAVAVTTRDEPSGRGVVGTAIREDRPVLAGNAPGEARMTEWHSDSAGDEFAAAAAFPLHLQGQTIGAIALYSGERGYFDAEETDLFAELAGDVSFALEAIQAQEQKDLTEEALRDSEQRYRELFDKNPNPMWVYDCGSLAFLAVNDAAVAGYGYSRAEFLAMTLRDIRPPEDVPALLESLRSSTGGLQPGEAWRHVRKDGTVIDVEITGHDVGFYGRPARLVSAIDISERRRLEAQLAEATRMEAMGHLAGGIAHDFNNLLTAVNGYSEALVSELGDDPLAEDAREIRRAGERAAELTRQVLAFARRQVLATRAVDVNVVVAGVSQMLGRLIGEHVRLVTKRSREPAVVMADPGQLEQVLVNLAINARDAMPDGGRLEIRVERVEEAGGLGPAVATDRTGPSPAITGPAVLLTVTDTGAGMDEATLTHAFEPFFTTKGAGAGTGLGLASVYGIVHQSNGEVWAESVPGHGTRVSILLSAVDETPHESGEATLAVPRPAGQGTILVVEDEPAVRGFAVATLERAGYKVLVASAPAEAIALIDGLHEPIDLVLTDMVMPGGSGQALAERLLESRPSLHVVLMSGYDATLAAMPPGRQFHFLAKPFGGRELTAMIARVLAE